MSLLDTTTQTRAQSCAKRAVQIPLQMLNQMLRQWNNGLDLIWNQPSPADVLAAIGTNGVELFQRSAALAAFLESQKPGCTNTPQAARIKAVTLNADGTVTLAAAAG
jgi:hypothetical protein